MTDRDKIIDRIIKHATALEACINRSAACNPNHPKFLLAKALKDLRELKPND